VATLGAAHRDPNRSVDGGMLLPSILDNRFIPLLLSGFKGKRICRTVQPERAEKP